MKEEIQSPKILYLLIITVVLLLIANLGLFFRMNQLQATIEQLFSNGSRTQEHTYVPVGEKAPSFSLTDIDGKVVSLHQFFGRYTILVFSSPTCPACKLVYPQLENFKIDHPEVNLLLLSYGSKNENQNLIETEKLTIPLLLGEKQVFEMYKVNFTPTFYLIDTEGVILKAGGSLTTIEEMYQQLR